MASEWYASEALNEALERTNELLLKKFNLNFWLKLALVVFLIGGGFNLNSGFNWSGGDKTNFNADVSSYLPMIVIVIAILIVIGLVFAFIRAVCQFIFIETIASNKIELVSGFKRNLDSGFNLFLFNVGLALVSLILLVIAFSPIIYIIIKGTSEVSTLVLVVLAVAGIVIAIGIAIIMGLIETFTNDFAIVLMHKEKKGIINGWKRVFDLIKNNLKQFAVYLIVKIAIGVVAVIILGVIGIVITIIALIFILVLAIGIGVVLLGVVIALGLSTGALLWLLIPAIIIAIVYFMAVAYINVLITLPIPVFFRYYSILFLQHLEPTLDLIAKEKQVTEKKGNGKRRGKET